MSQTSSATGGFLPPAEELPNDLALDVLLQRTVAGITGIAGNLIRPRWQPTPPTQPEASVNWAAVGITAATPMAWGYEDADPTSTNRRRTSVHFEMEALVSFYGPASAAMATRLTVGLMVPQNLEALFAVGLSLVGVGEPTNVPEQISQQWIRRTDLPIQLRRNVRMSYAVLSLLRAQGLVLSESTDAPILTPLPPA
jgi:hypothetical protein